MDHCGRLLTLIGSVLTWCQGIIDRYLDWNLDLNSDWDPYRRSTDLPKIDPHLYPFPDGVGHPLGNVGDEVADLLETCH